MINDGCKGIDPTTPVPTLWGINPSQGGEQRAVEEKCIRKDLVEKALNDIGVTYRMATDKKQFQVELRNNFFTDYMILGDFNPIEDGFVSELRERIYSGKGLISSLWHTQKIAEDIFGIGAINHLPGRDYPVEMLENSILSGQTLQTHGKAVNVEVETGNVLGWINGTPSLYQKEREKNEGQKHPAAVKREFGNGKTLFYAFDLGMSVNEANYNRIAEIFKISLDYIHRPVDTESFMPYDLVPLRTSIKSLGGSFDLKMTESYPTDERLFDPSTGQWTADNPWTKEIHLDINETREIDLLASMPDAKGTYTLTTDVGYSEEGSYKPYQSLTTQINVEKDSSILINDILYKLGIGKTALSDGNESAKMEDAIGYIEGVRNRVIYAKDDLAYNIRDVLKAIEAVTTVKSSDVREMRLDMDRLLSIYSERWHSVP